MKQSLVEQLKNQVWAGYTIPQILGNYQKMVEYLKSMSRPTENTSEQCKAFKLQALRILKEIGEME